MLAYVERGTQPKLRAFVGSIKQSIQMSAQNFFIDESALKSPSSSKAQNWHSDC